MRTAISSIMEISSLSMDVMIFLWWDQKVTWDIACGWCKRYMTTTFPVGSLRFLNPINPLPNFLYWKLLSTYPPVWFGPKVEPLGPLGWLNGWQGSLGFGVKWPPARVFCHPTLGVGLSEPVGGKRHGVGEFSRGVVDTPSRLPPVVWMQQLFPPYFRTRAHHPGGFERAPLG